MERKVIYVDFDSTIVNAEKAVCAFYNDMYKDHPEFVPADWTKHGSWDFRYVCPLIHKEMEKPVEFVTSIFCRDEFFERLEFYDDAERVLKSISEVHDVIICTSATPKNASKKVLWIEEHLPFVGEVLVVINSGSNGVGKGRVHMIEMNSVFIDDHPSNLNSTKAEKKYLFKMRDTDFNGEWDGDVISSWKQIEEMFL